MLRILSQSVPRWSSPILAVLIAALFLSTTMLQARSPESKRIDGGIAIVGATVIDMIDERPKTNMTVVVRDGRITAVAPSASLILGASVQQIDGRGRYLIPGLWDMHTHVAEYASIWLPAMLADGITGVRNMHAVSLDLTKQVAAQVDKGELAGPRFIANGQLVDGPGSSWPTAIVVKDADDARQAVDRLHDGGADFIKVYSFLSRESYFAIADEAKRLHMPFAGHVTQSISALEATRAGQHSIEHLDGVLMASAFDEADLREKFGKASALWRNPATGAEGRTAMTAVYRDLASHYDAKKASQLFAAFVANDTYQTPTLVTHWTNIHRGEREFLENPALRYIPASLRKQWTSLAPPNAEMKAGNELLYARYKEVIRQMRAAGVPLLAGTDTGGTMIVPGDSLHRELALLVDAGLTPFQALHSATIEPARYFHQEKNAGTVAVGKRADLVLLDDNPLKNIANTRSVQLVIRDGKVYDRSQLDALLTKAEADAAKS